MKYTLLLIIVVLSVELNLFAQDVITSNINSQFDEQGPLISADGKYLFFTIAHNEHNIGGIKDKGDIWYSVWQDSVWSLPFHGGAVINNEGWNGIIGFDERGGMYLHHHYEDNKQGISIANKKEDYWEKPVNVGVPYFMNKSNYQSGSISPDGRVMLLSLESYGTIGAEDIYVLFKNGNRWTEPKSVGSVINTRFQEMTPVIAADNQTIFFASNGLKGKGSMDIYKSTRLDDSWLNWSIPVNVEEVNTEGRELSFNIDVDSNMSWVVTTKDSDGYGDIRFFESEQTLEEIVQEKDSVLVEPSVDTLLTASSDSLVMVQGSIYDSKDSTSIEAHLEFISIEQDTIYKLISNNIANKYAVNLPRDTYSLKIAAPNYLPHLEVLEFNDSNFSSITKDYWLMAVKTGEAVQLDHVLFERGKAIMLPSSYSDLDAVVEMLFDNPTMEIELAGHTDNQGSSKLNFKLSEERVEAVIQYMLNKGISSKRITGRGYGGSRPIASNKNPETRKLNRRVEFTIMKN